MLHILEALKDTIKVNVMYVVEITCFKSTAKKEKYILKRKSLN